MRKSVIMRRVLALLVLTILISATLTYLFYALSSDYIYTKLGTEDYKKKAVFLSSLTSETQSGRLSAAYYQGVIESAPDLVNAAVAVYLPSQTDRLIIRYPGNRTPDDRELSDLAEFFNKTGIPKSNDSYIAERVHIGKDRVDTLVVGVPILRNDYASGEEILSGYLYVLGSFEAISSGQTSLNYAIVFASCAAFLIMILPAILLLRTLVRPIKRINEIANAMANGHFDLRADTSGKGEIGELAASINNLAEALDRSISALMIERNRLKQILDGLSEGILATDSNLKITHINPALRELFSDMLKNQDSFSGSEPESEEGFATSAINEDITLYGFSKQHPEVSELTQKYREIVISGKASVYNFDADDIVVQMQAAALFDSKSNVIGVVGLFRDITSDVKLEQTRREYVANISHELRTPLTALRGLIEPLSDGLVKNPSDVERYYKIIYDETLRLSRLVDDMLELSRLQAGVVSLKMSVFSLSDVFENLKLKYAPIARDRRIHLSFPDSFSNPLVYSNPDRTEQILVILLDNAFKFTPEGGKIEISLLETDDKYEVSVQDTGPGVSSKDIKHVFERFYKAEKSRGKSGTGLGLSIAREIIMAMHEKIYLVSREGQGAKFTFTVSKYKDSPEES